MAKIHFLNVDEGDCTIIQHDNGKVTMIDICCGNIETEETNALFSANEALGGIKGNFHQKEHPNNPIAYLKKRGISSIFRYIQTHPDMDHMDGLNRLYIELPILNFWDTENKKEQTIDDSGKARGYLKEDWDCYQKLRKMNSDPKALFYYDGNRNKYYAEDDKGALTDDFIQILSPTIDLIKAANDAGDWNDSSYILLYCIHGFKVLFCGDADMGTINHLPDNHKQEISDIDVLVAPHHGRDSNKDFSFLDVMKPKLTLMGNAKSKFMAYKEWNDRKLKHITNNQADNVLIEFEDKCMRVSVSNKTFADKYCQENWKHNSCQHDELKDYWRIFRREK